MRALIFISIFIFCAVAIEDWIDSLSPKERVYYRNAQTNNLFVCYDDSKTIPWEYVNDHFCDCSDGSDEPLNSACISNRKFECKKGFSSLPKRFLTDSWFISVSKVEDGICDCCDGADEPNTECPNTCDNFQEHWKSNVSSVAALHKKGHEIKLKSIEKTKKKGNVNTLLSQINSKLGSELNSLATMRFSSEQHYNFAYKLAMRLQKEQRVLDSLKDFGPKNLYFELLQNHESDEICYSIVRNEKAFKGGSFEHNALDFKFEICPFRSVTMQQFNETNPYMETTLLGVFKRWYEEPKKKAKSLRASSAILGDTIGPIMIYTDGDPCWNGPDRTVYVALECGLKTQIRDVYENGKCLYEIILETPVACDSKIAKQYLELIEEEKHVHDEL